MRTKLFLTAAVASAFGISTSIAQVYSVNAVGYINLTMLPGFNLVGNQLNRTPNNSLNNAIMGAPIESQVLKFANNSYQLELFDGTTWIKPDGNPGTLSANPGEGLFFFNPGTTPLTITLVGDVPQGSNLLLCLPPGFSLVCSIVPQAIPLAPQNGFPSVPEMQFIAWDPVTQTYKQHLFNDGSTWILPDGTPVSSPTAAVGEGFFVFNPNNTTVCWPRSFSVN